MTMRSIDYKFNFLYPYACKGQNKFTFIKIDFF